MACGECGDPRNLCRCVITSGDSSVTVTGDGSDGNPYVISAPGAGAGTRENDRAGVYDNTGSGTYPEIPPEYPHLDFYGPADPADIPGYIPAQFDGWYRTVPGAPIALRSSTIVDENTDPGEQTLTVILPEVQDGDVAILTIGAATSTVVPAPGWVGIISTSGNAVLTAGWYLDLKATDSNTAHTFSGLAAPFGGYLEVYSGVSARVLDVPGLAATSGDVLVDHLDIVGIPAVTEGSLLLSACTIGAANPTLVPPLEMSTVNGSNGVAYRHQVATMVGTGAGAKTWSHTPASPGQLYSAIVFALRAAMTTVYYLWINGRWMPVGGSSGSSSGGGVGNGAGTGYAISLGDGVNSTFSVVHPLNTLDVLVECVNLSTGQTCYPVVRRTSNGAVYLDFGDTTPEPQSRRVLMTKVG